MRRFLFEEKEYRYRARFRRNREIRDPIVELARLLRSTSKRKGFVSRASRGPDRRQKCNVKMQYSSSIQAHKAQLEKYLGREGAGIDGSIPEIFGTDTELYRQHMTGRNFRIFLSPQENKYDLKELSEKFIERLEKQTGFKLYWQGACHHNTAHHHAHLLINGYDKQGKEVYVPRDIVKTFMRETARDLCTMQAGPRTQQDIELEKEKELSAARYTRLDEDIQGLSSNLRIPASRAVNNNRVLIRLDNLRKLKLCNYQNGEYVLKDNWEEDLRNNSRYNTFLQAREELQYTAPSLMKVYSGEQGTVTGKVTKIYSPNDDTSNNHVVILESLDGKAYFVPLLKRPELRDGENKSGLKEGELITVTAFKTQKGRMTPLFYKKNIRGAKKEVRQNNHYGALADEVVKTKTGGWSGV